MTAAQAEALTNANSESYLQDVVWQSKYNPEQNPLLLRYITGLNGYGVEPLSTRFGYYDLGCADGRALNTLAVMFPEASFVGVDLNPDHLALARESADELGLTNVEFHQCDFADLDRLDVGPLDFVTCSGAFSWIHPDLQEAVVAFAGRRLAPGGIFLVQYATAPGKIQMEPLWHLMRALTEGVEGTSADRARAGIEAITALRDRGAAFFGQNPLASQRTEALAGENPWNVAHHALGDWRALYHRDVAHLAGAYGLGYAGCLPVADNLASLKVPHAFADLVDSEEDPSLRETIADFVTNRGTRTDLYVNAVRGVTDPSRAFADMAFGLITITGAIPAQHRAPSGTVIDYGSPVHAAITRQLRAGACTLEELEEAMATHGFGALEVRQGLHQLVAGDAIVPVRDRTGGDRRAGPQSIRVTNSVTRALLAAPILLDRVLSLPSPLLGQAVLVRPLIALLLKGMLHQPREGVVEWATRGLTSSGIAIPPEYESLAEFVADRYAYAIEHYVPRLVGLGVLEVAD